MKIGFGYGTPFNRFPGNCARTVKDFNKAAVGTNLNSQIIVRYVIRRKGEITFHRCLDLNQTSISRSRIMVPFYVFEEFKIIRFLDEDLTNVPYKPTIQSESFLGISRTQLFYNSEHLPHCFRNRHGDDSLRLVSLCRSASRSRYPVFKSWKQSDRCECSIAVREI